MSIGQTIAYCYNNRYLTLEKLNETQYKWNAISSDENKIKGFVYQRDGEYVIFSDVIDEPIEESGIEDLKDELETISLELIDPMEINSLYIGLPVFAFEI